MDPIEPDMPKLPDNRLRHQLRILYDDLAEDVARAGPVCELSGRCCRFAEYDHTLFLSGPEAALLLADAPEPSRPLDDGLTCPWQDDRGHCTARETRPLGCRVYFCDPTYQERSHGLSEHYLSRLKTLANQMGLAWSYAPLHDHLRLAEQAGRFPRSRVQAVADDASSSQALDARDANSSGSGVE